MVLTIKCRDLKTAEEKDWPYDEVAFAQDLLKAWQLKKAWRLHKDEDEIPNDRIWSDVLIFGHFPIQMHGPNWLSIRMGVPQKPHLFFYYRYYRSTPELEFEPVFPCPDTEINHERETIIVDFLGQKMEITAAPRHEGLWPWILLGIDEIREKLLKRVIAIEKLQYFLGDKKSETNPLSILIHSPQPYRGLAFQIVEKLKEIKNLLN